MDWLKKFKNLGIGALADYLPQTGLECVSWVELMKQATRTLKVSADVSTLKHVKREFVSQLPASYLQDSSGLFSVKGIISEDSEVRRYWGEKILEIYFTNVLGGKYLHLDYRPYGFFFSKDISDPKFFWNLSRFFMEIDHDFSKHVALLYKGYYGQRPKDFKQALIDMGLLGSDQDSMEIENIISGFLGPMEDKSVDFSSQKFKRSFFTLFKYLKKQKRKIPSQLIWVGLALAGVFESLELIGAEYQVRDIYKKVTKSLQLDG